MSDSKCLTAETKPAEFDPRAHKSVEWENWLLKMVLHLHLDVVVNFIQVQLPYAHCDKPSMQHTYKHMLTHTTNNNN